MCISTGIATGKIAFEMLRRAETHLQSVVITEHHKL